MKKFLRDFVNGLAFGLTQIVPGVSGGTVAIIMGFYGELIESINRFAKEKRRRLRFFIPLAAGAAVGVVAFGSLIDYLLNSFSFPTMLFFIGLIAGIIPLIYKKITAGGRFPKKREGLICACAFVFLIALSMFKNESAPAPEIIVQGIGAPYVIFLFVTGMLAAAALVTPGLSGSLVLILTGVYPVATYSLSNVGRWLAEPSNLRLAVDVFKVLAPLGVGIIAGGLLTARLIEALLNKYRSILFSAILGLLSGSVAVLFKDPIVYKSGVSALIISIGAAASVIGFVVSYLIGRKKI